MATQHAVAVKLLRLARPQADGRAELALPAGFGNIYLGEPLAFAVVVAADREVRGVRVRAELQTAGNKALPLLDAAHDVLGVAEHRVRHDVRELGMHILVVQVVYNSDQYLRKFYKFQALNPFHVRTKTTALPSGRCALEVAVQNMAAADVRVGRVAFVPVPEYACTPLVPRVRPWAPQDAAQFLYLLVPTAGAPVLQLGRLEVEWDGAADAGRLQTPPLQRKPLACADLDVRVVLQPSATPLGVPFDVILSVTNATSLTIALTAHIPPAFEQPPEQAAPPPPAAPVLRTSGSQLAITRPASLPSTSDAPPHPPPSTAPPTTVSQTRPHPSPSSTTSSTHARHRGAAASPTPPATAFNAAPLPRANPTLAPSLTVLGASHVAVGDLAPAATVRVALRCAGLRRGFLHLPTIQWADAHTGVVRDVDARVVVHVT